MFPKVRCADNTLADKITCLRLELQQVLDLTASVVMRGIGLTNPQNFGEAKGIHRVLVRMQFLRRSILRASGSRSTRDRSPVRAEEAISLREYLRCKRPQTLPCLLRSTSLQVPYWFTFWCHQGRTFPNMMLLARRTHVDRSLSSPVVSHSRVWSVSGWVVAVGASLIGSLWASTPFWAPSSLGDLNKTCLEIFTILPVRWISTRKCRRCSSPSGELEV